MAWVYVSLGGALLVVIGIVIVGFVAWPDRGEWYPHETPSGPVMRRHVNGKMETRPMTPTEREKYLISSIRW